MCKRPWPEFLLFLNQFHTVCPKIETKFLGKLEIFRKLRRNFFRPKSGGLQKKKKKSLRRNWDWFFGQIRKFKRLRGGAVFPWGGGAIFNFSQKIGLKSIKNVRFCILHKPMAGARAPPPLPGYATGCMHVLLYANMLKETEETRIFCHIFIIGGISIGERAGPTGPPLATSHSCKRAE